MAKQTIDLGTGPNKGDGDVLRTAFGKINDNFTELYATASADVQIPSQATHDGKFLTTNGSALSWGTVTIPSDVSDLTDNTNLLSGGGGGTGILDLQTVPTTKYGQSGDTKGMVAIDSVTGEFYYCVSNYTDGLTSIWRKMAGSDAW